MAGRYDCSGLWCLYHLSGIKNRQYEGRIFLFLSDYDCCCDYVERIFIPIYCKIWKYRKADVEKCIPADGKTSAMGIVAAGDFASALSIYIIPVLLVVIPAVASIVFDFILERLFRRYMSPEDLAREEENDMYAS